MELNLANLLLVLLAGWLAGSLATRLNYPSVLGELLVGILLGPPLLGLLDGGPALAVLAEVGVLLMMLYVGMEIDPRELGKASWAGFLAAAGGFVTPFVLAFFTVRWFGGSTMGAIFVGIAAGVTSLTTKSRILVDLKLLDTRIAHVMMAGALITDTLSLVIFAAVLGVVEAGSLQLATVGMVTLKVVVFFAATAFIGLRVFPVVGRWLTKARLTDRTFNFTLILLLAVAFGEMAHLAGLHAILGAFVAGLFLRDNVLGRTLSHDLMGAVRDASIGFLAPVFFVTAGFEVSFSVFRAELPLFVAIMVVATVGKIAGTALFYLPSGNGWREGIAVGTGMNGRGAVEIIVAGIALEMGLISREIFSILVFMAIFTTATVPVFLKWTTEWLRRRGELVRSTADRAGTLVLGAGPVARMLARELSSAGPVWVLDSNRARCGAAAEEGLSVTCGNALQEQALSDAHASQASSLAAVTPNAEVNALAVQIARSVFEVPEVHVAHGTAQGSGHSATQELLRATTLFAGPVDLGDWDHWVARGRVDREEDEVTEPASAVEFVAALADGPPSLPLAVRRDEAVLPFTDRVRLQPGDAVVVLRVHERRRRARDDFDALVADCAVLDVPGGGDADELFRRAAAALAGGAGEEEERLYARMHERERTGSTVMSPGLAIPHVLVEGEGRFDLLMARSREGFRFPGEPDPVHAVFVLLSTPDQRTLHLRALSAISQVVQQPGFERAWLDAPDERRLRELVLAADRPRF